MIVTIQRALCLGVLLAAPAFATPWTVLGPRPLGMGGAFVGLADDPVGAYWNPAALGRSTSPFGIQIPAGARGEFTGTVLEGANDLHEVARECANGNCSDGDIERALERMDHRGNGALADAGAGVDGRSRHLAFFFNTLAVTGATPVVDRQNNTRETVQDNQSRIVVRGAEYFETGVGYGRELRETGLFLGANAKAVVGRVGYTEIRVVNDKPGVTNALRDFDRDAEISVQPGLDLGALWNPEPLFPGALFHPLLGIVGRNLNDPKFSQPSAGKAAGEKRNSLDPQFRAGVSVNPLPFWYVTSDLDLTDNDTPVRGFTSRVISAGTEINVFHRPWINIPLRVGLAKNLSESDSSLSWTGGFGLNLFHVLVDVGGAVSDQTTSVESRSSSEKVPTNFAFSAQAAVLF